MTETPATTAEPFDPTQTREICREHIGNKGDLLIVLQKIQSVYGYVPRETFPIVSGALGATGSEIFGVLTFYNRFHLSPRGKHTIRACRGTACHFKGSGEIIASIRRRYGLEQGQDTTADTEFSLEEVACLGACGIAPVMTVDEDTFGNLTPLEALGAINRYGKELPDNGSQNKGADPSAEPSAEPSTEPFGNGRSGNTEGNEPT
jgi:NADH-quinone oxidoreductase subunit E